MRQIPPQPLKERYWLGIQKEIERLFNETLFIPLYEAVKLPAKEIKNAPSTPLERAIADGTVYYRDGKFEGKFNAAISKELRDMGATWNAKSKTFTYSAALPAGVSLAVATAAARYSAIKSAVLQTLDDIRIGSIDDLGNLPEKYSKTIQWIDDDWNKALKGITVSPKLTDEEQNSISLEYSHDLSKYIKGWTEETILELRQDVQGMVYAGQRPDAIAKLIQNKYGQSVRKARFLAHQETSLLMSSFHRSRMKSIGVKLWRWMTVGDERVRHDHRILDGKVFPIDEPPVVDLRTGERAYAGQPFGCRCQMIALLGDENG